MAKKWMLSCGMIEPTDASIDLIAAVLHTSQLADIE